MFILNRMFAFNNFYSTFYTCRFAHLTTSPTAFVPKANKWISVTWARTIPPTNRYFTQTFWIQGVNHNFIRSFFQCLYVYDILLVNDKVLTNKPLRERAKILRDVIQPIPGRVQFSDIKIGKTSKDITDALFEAIDRYAQSRMAQ